jgi:hypothetical protein
VAGIPNGIFQNDICEFESSQPSHGVRSRAGPFRRWTPAKRPGCGGFSVGLFGSLAASKPIRVPRTGLKNSRATVLPAEPGAETACDSKASANSQSSSTASTSRLPIYFDLRKGKVIETDERWPFCTQIVDCDCDIMEAQLPGSTRRRLRCSRDRWFGTYRWQTCRERQTGRSDWRQGSAARIQ